MGLFESKRIKELELERDKLKEQLNNLYEREENIRHLNEVLKKMRLEVAELNEKKLAISTELEQLRDEKRKKTSELENLDKEIAHLREMKFEEQSTLLSYTKQIQELDEYIRNAQDNPDFRSALNEELTIDRNELFAIRKRI